MGDRLGKSMAERAVVVIPAEQVQVRAGKKKDVLRVAAYCRVSTDEERQLGSFDNQIEYFTRLIEEKSNYELVEIFSDEGISGCRAKCRKGFQKMIKACDEGRVDLVITKSISRFARNTQDSLNYTRKLKDMGIGVYFEKEGINTLESSGELLLTLFSCFAQEESRSISENTSWGIRSKFQQGIPHLNAENILGYDKDADGNLIINEAQAAVVRRIYREYLEGWSLSAIAKRLNSDGIAGVRGEPNWCATTIGRLLENEKYKGSMLMQKTFTANYLTKQTLKNTGQLNQYFIESNHAAIIDTDEWEAVQEETARRRSFIRSHGLRGMFGSRGDSAFYAKFFCEKCGCKLQRIYHRGVSKPYWECASCGRKAEDERVRIRFCAAFNRLVDERGKRIARWQEIQCAGSPLQRVRAKQFMAITAEGRIGIEIPELTQAVLQEAWLDEGGQIRFVFLIGDEITE